MDKSMFNLDRLMAESSGRRAAVMEKYGEELDAQLGHEMQRCAEGCAQLSAMERAYLLGKLEGMADMMRMRSA